MNVRGSVQCKGVNAGSANFFNSLLKLSTQKQPMSYVKYIIKIDQIQMSHDEIASKNL